MIIHIKNKVKLLVLFLILFYNVSAKVPAQTVPAFTFYKLDKSVFTNKNLAQGKALFFVFFDPACEHCQIAVKSLSDHYTEVENAAVYLISTDSAATINQFMQKYGKTLYNKKNVTLLQDRKDEFLAKFQPRRFPGMFLYSSDKNLMRYEDNEDTMFRFYKEINSVTK